MKVTVSEDNQHSTYLHITGTGQEQEAIQNEKTRLEKQGFRVVGDLMLDLDIQEITIFLEKKK